jgi:hypothetical protein
MSDDVNPYAPPPEPKSAHATSLAALPRPDEPPLGTHRIDATTRPPSQATLTFYRDRFYLDRDGGEDTFVVTQRDFLDEHARIFMGGTTSLLLGVKTKKPGVVRLTTEARRTFRSWIEPHVSGFLDREVRTRARLGVWLGLITLITIALSHQIRWVTLVDAAAFAAIAGSRYVVPARTYLLLYAIAWVVLAIDNVFATVGLRSSWWLVASFGYVLIALGSARAYAFFAPPE